MRVATIGLTVGLVIGGIAAGKASAPATIHEDLAGSQKWRTVISNPAQVIGEVVIARRGRGADDPPGDDHGRRHGGKGKGKGGKGRGGHDDGPNHT